MSTQAYYKDRLGFDPQEALRDGAAVNGGTQYYQRPVHMTPNGNGHDNGTSGPHDQVYEENLTKFKDERDAIQKKTFTKWVNKHLKKANRHVNDLFEDLRDGLNLMSLLEVLSGEHLPREKGRMRFHMLQNVQMTLSFLHFKKIKVVNIRAEDIVDGNPKLTLGLIWTIILHFQISDIVGQETNVTAREALLRWAKRSTAKYPGVRVNDFTSSWRDGLAFNALIHRNRPDLIDWRNIRGRHVRERLETAFHVVEKEYGVTRLLDAEDVDTHEPDEKSLITYISSLYDVFPEPPAMHPLYDMEAQQRAGQYRELASSLHAWIREKAALMQDRAFPPTLIEMRKLLAESQRFRSDEVPPKQREKQKLQHVYRELEKYFESVGECDIEPELRPEILEQNWSRLMMAHQERERDIQEEIRRLEKLQRLAEKVHREIKQTDTSLDALERRIESESRRLERGAHPTEAKAAAEHVEAALRQADQDIQELFRDVQVLRDGRYSQAQDLHSRVTVLHQRWMSVRAAFQTRIMQRLGGVSLPVQQTTVRRETRTVLETRIADTNHHFTQLMECAQWCRDRLKQLQEADYGSDLPSVLQELDRHQREHKVIDQFHSKVEQCVQARSNFTGEELVLYNQHLSQLQKLYAELLSTSTKRLSDLDALHDFLQSASAELNWLNEKEQIEITRDWADPHINLTAVEEYYEQLMSSLEKRELQFSAVIDRGEAMIAQQHVASRVIESHLQVMQSQWAWVLQLTLCLETHLKHTTEYHNFFQEIKEVEKWMSKREEVLNTTFSQSEFTLDQGESLLRGMQELREELNQRGEAVARVVQRSTNVYPIRQRKQPVTRPIKAVAVCAYTSGSLSLEKNSSCTVVDVSGRTRWRVRGGAGEAQVPSAALALPPPCQEALDAAQALQERYDRLLALWQRKQLRMRQNMIFATIKVVKGWDLAQFLAMGAEQRGAIRRALNEDADKLLREGDPGDPQLRRLRREMDDVNRLFDEFERRARAEEESKNAARIFSEQSGRAGGRLDALERRLHERVAAGVPRDLSALEQLVLDHKDWEADARALAPDIDEMQETFRGIALKTPAMKKTLDKVMGKWESMWSTSKLYVDRLKCVEIILNSLEENGQVISEFELKLAQYSDLPNDADLLKDIHEDLVHLQTAVSQQQIQVDQMNDDWDNCRRVTDKSRSALPHTSSLPRSAKHPDLERLDRDVDKLNTRWNNVCAQLVDRLRSCEAAYNLMKNYQAGLEKETEWIDDAYSKLQTQPPPEVKPKENLDQTRNLLTSVVERTPKIEKVNMEGGRFIREAKIYSSRCQRYGEWLGEEVHPSMAPPAAGRAKPAEGGAERVARQLDRLNAAHQGLLDLLYERLRRIAASNPGDIVTLRLVEAMAPRSARSFRQEFNMHDIASTEHTVSTHYTTSSQYIRTTEHSESDGLSSPLRTTVTVNSKSPYDSTTTNGKTTSFKTTTIINGKDANGIADLRNLKRVHKMYEGSNIIESRGIVHPETREVLTVGQAISMRILDVRTGRIITSIDTRQSVPIEQAAQDGLIDANLASRLVGPCGTTEDGKEVTLLEAIQRELYDAEQGFSDPAEKRIKQAVEEKYRLCDEQLNKLLDWVSDIEERLANQEPVKEDKDDLRNQINNIKQIKEELESQQRAVAGVGEQARQLVVTGGAVLAAREADALERAAHQLRERADRAGARAATMHRRLQAAWDEMAKFSNELTTFNAWLDTSYRTLEEQERALAQGKAGEKVAAARDFLGDVMAHQADLRFITMAAQKFVDESKEFLSLLNDFRTSLPSRYSHLLQPTDSEVRAQVQLAGRRHADLLARAQRLQERLRGVGDTRKLYGDAVDKASRWLKEIEPQCKAVISEVIAGDPKAVEAQLTRAKALHNEMLAQSRLIDNAKDACDQLLQTLEGHLTPQEIRALEVPVLELESKYGELSGALGQQCGLLEGALLQSQGLQDALEGQASWINQAENQFKSQFKPASLIRERLDEQLREHKISSADLVGHRPSLEQLATSARSLLATASNARLATKIDQKMKDVYNRYEKLLEKSNKRGEFLEEVSAELNQFSGQATQAEQWCAKLMDRANSSELSRMSPEECQLRMDQLAEERDSRKQLVDECLRNGKQLISKKDVTDTQVIRDRMKGLEVQWKDLITSMDDKQKLSKQRADQLNQYEKLRAQVVNWLSNTEEKVNRLQPVAVEMEVLESQQNELRPLVKEYRDYGHHIDKVNEVGSIYDALLRGDRPDSPHRKRSSQTAYSPTKRPSQASLRGADGRSPSPTKSTGLGLVSPISASGSSGFSSRRSSQDGFHLDEMSPVQQQLSEINNRYNLLGVKLSDRQTELDSVKEEVRKHLDSLKNLSLFLDKVQRQLPKDTVPNTKEEADKTNKQVRAVLEDMYEKQSLLDSTKSQVKELIRRKAGVIGADRLQDEMEDVASRWKKLNDACKDKIKMMEEMKDFLDTHDSLVSWLGAKDRMMAALGPISSDSRMVQTQVQQVQVLREELRTQQPQLSHLEEVGASVLERLKPRSPDHTRVAGKLSALQARWADLLNRLDARAESLGAAVDTTREFDAGLTRLRDALQTISDNLDDLPLEKDSEEQLRKIENLERQLEGQRPLLAELEARGAALCEVLTEPACRQDIQAKLAQVGRQYAALQRKLDHRKAEQEGALRDGRQLEESVARTLGWIQGELGELAGRLLVSADRDKLKQQLEKHGPAYREAMAKEHEVIMLLNKGREMENRPAHPNLRKELDRIQQQWEKLRREVVDRQTRLQTAMEHCKKFGKAQEQFLPWLAQAEDKLDKLAPAAFKKKNIEKQLRELQQIRNDIWKKSGEYENNRTLGETFVSACDVDQDIVKDQLGELKNRWDKLNNDMMEKLDWLENTSHRLADFTDQSRDIEHALRRCEDRLSAAETSPADRRLLDTVGQIAEEASLLDTPIKNLHSTADVLASAAREVGADAQNLLDEADSFKERLTDLNSRLGDVKGKLQNATTAVAQFNEQVKGLSLDLSELERDLDTMKPPGREIKVVRQQLDDLGRFYKKLEDVASKVSLVQKTADSLLDSGVASDASQTREQVETLRKQLAKLDERARNKEQELDDALAKLEAFYVDYDNVMGDLKEVGEIVRKMKPVGSEVEQIRSQQKELASARRDTLEPLGEAVAKANRAGRSLVQGAAPQVPTQRLEADLEKMNDAWNQIMEKTNERERRLDSALLQSGRLREALSGLERWLADTEAMVAAQRPPSADYKVVKAQLQEQKFLNKMLLDRQGSMSSLFAMGGEVAAGCEPAERRAIEQQLKGLVGRFEALTDGAQKRMLDLEQAMRVAKQFQEQLQPLLEWLGVTERKVKVLELVPTDEEKIQQRIREHKVLHDDILSKRPDFSELTETASTLMGLVGEDEATALADRLQAATDRYQALADSSLSAGELLERSRSALRHLVLTYQELGAWMDAAERRLRRARPLPVHTDALLRLMDDLAELTEEIASKQEAVESTVESGLELMKHISGDEALQLKDKLDALQRRYGDLTSRGADLLRAASEALPLLQHFHNSHNKLVDWMGVAEAALQTAEPREQDIIRLEEDLQHFRPVLEAINLVGPQLCQISPGEGAATIEGLMTRDNRRFDAIVEQIQRKAERLHLSKLRSREVAGDMDELLEWFREADERLRNAAPPGCEPPPLRAQLKEHRAFNDDVSGQRARVRDLISNAKKVLRESQPSEDMSIIRDKMEELRETMETVGQLSSDRLGILEQALPLAEHFADTHDDLSTWLDDMERQIGMLAMPALRPEQIAAQQDKNEMLMQSINEHKPLVDKLVKTGEALAQLCSEEDAQRLHETAEGDCARYAALRAELRARQQALEGALQESALFADKLEGMLRALAGARDQLGTLEPVSAHPPKIEDQIEENNAIIEDLDKREEAYAAVKRAANDVISKASNKADPAVKDIKKKLERLNSLWNEIQKTTGDRGRSLEETLELARRFWRELTAVMSTLRELGEALAAQEAPAAQPRAIQAQQVALQEIRQEIDQTKPEVEQVRKTGSKLMNLCGEPDKPEVKKHIEDLDSAWDNITALYAKREENLIDAMEKAMEFHETLQNLLEFLETAEEKFARMGPLGSDIDAVKKQIQQLNKFKDEVDPHMVKVEALNRQAQELTERTSSEQAASIREPLAGVNRRWAALVAGVAERQRRLEGALLRLGQFQHALQELMVWIDRSDATLDSLKPVAGDPQVLEVELAKLKVLANDIQAHQNSVDTLNDAGLQIIQQGKGTDEASTTQDKLQQLNRKWRDLQQKAKDRQLELEEALREAQRFHAEIQDLLSWLGDVDSIIAASKPVGGLPETASEQLERFMEVFNEVEENRPKVEAVLQQGQEYLKKQDRPQSVSNLQHNLKTLKQRWDSVTARASDKKIKLEIALKEATEFHDALQAFVDWLTNAEKVLTSAKPVSRVMETILSQIEEHKSFQKEVSTHRETMLHLDKKGTHLKYFSQKQDVILIKNLLVSVQHRWERVVAKAAERTRALDHGFKEAREFHDQWSSLMNWLTDTEKSLDELNAEQTVNDPEKIKHRLDRHREFQKALGAKQPVYDSAMKCGKQLKDKAPKNDEPVLRQMLGELKSMWTTVCSKAVDRQRKLEEALLFSGQFKDAMSALLDWLKKQEAALKEDTPVHGDLDTVMGLVEKHKQLEESLNSRSAQMESVIRTGRELVSTAPPQDAAQVSAQLSSLSALWQSVNRLCDRKTSRLEEALKEAEKLHKSVHMLLEWLSDAEAKLRFAAAAPEDEAEASAQLRDHERFLAELQDKARDKDATLALAHAVLAKAHPDGATVIKHWITIITSRWEEVSQWALQRHTKLNTHMQSLRNLDLTLEELLQWLMGLENTLLALESEPLPDNIELLEGLIQDHKDLMENTQKRQLEVDRVCKANQIKTVQGKDSPRKVSAKGPAKGQQGRGSQHDLHREREASPDYYGSLNRRQSRVSPGRETPDRNLPHYGPRFPPQGSKGSEPEFRSGRVKLLWEKWRGTWLLAWERQRRLHDHLMHLKELEQVRNFSWDDWRKRFLKFMNHKKSRLTDLFRKMDKDNNGLIPRDDFIDGIMNTKFDTFRLEMNAVADLFDRNNLGLIDWQEFIAALRPDWVDRRPETDADKIHDEVKRLVMLCTCRQKFRVFQVGEGKYRFGDSQKLRLVRILRSTVMVRVGGGWVALDEFLVKNDPCRAKGRTNIELREQFILADGVSQSMTAFKSKTPRSSTNTPPTIGSAGPITKVRERSARSVPMGATRATRSSLSAGTPDSLSDNEASLGQTPRSALKKPTLARSTLTPGGSGPSSRPSSRPASRTGSKPPSRHGSNLSLDSTDDGTPSRIPLSRRIAPSTNTARSGLSTPRTAVSKLGASNGSTRARTPTGLISPAPGRVRTPSGSSTPVLPGQTTAASRLLRKGSSASESSTAAGSATAAANGRKTPVRSSATPDRREPFRL